MRKLKESRLKWLSDDVAGEWINQELLCLREGLELASFHFALLFFTYCLSLRGSQQLLISSYHLHVPSVCLLNASTGKIPNFLSEKPHFQEMQECLSPGTLCRNPKEAPELLGSLFLMGRRILGGGAWRRSNCINQYMSSLVPRGSLLASLHLPLTSSV